jgi:hypothetical protein
MTIEEFHPRRPVVKAVHFNATGTLTEVGPQLDEIARILGARNALDACSRGQMRVYGSTGFTSVEVHDPITGQWLVLDPRRVVVVHPDTRVEVMDRWQFQERFEPVPVTPEPDGD